jgi:hypothetical protein
MFKKKTFFIILLFALVLSVKTPEISVSAASVSEKAPVLNELPSWVPTWETVSGWLKNVTQSSSSPTTTAVSTNSQRTVAKYVETAEDTERQTALDSAIEDFEKSIIGTVTNFLFGFAVLTSLLVLVIVVLKFGASGANPNDRNTAIIDLGICVLCIALLGSVKLITSLIIGITM